MFGWSSAWRYSQLPVILNKLLHIWGNESLQDNLRDTWDHDNYKVLEYFQRNIFSEHKANNQIKKKIFKWYWVFIWGMKICGSCIRNWEMYWPFYQKSKTLVLKDRRNLLNRRQRKMLTSVVISVHNSDFIRNPALLENSDL